MTMTDTVPETKNHHVRAVREQDGWMVWTGDDQAEYFGLYRHQPDGTSQCIADFTDRADAVTAMAAIEESSSKADALAPGEYLSEWMDVHGLTPEHVATALRTDLDEVVDVLHGAIEIDVDLALGLSRLTGSSAVTWLMRESQYHEALTRLAMEHGTADADDEEGPCPYFCEHPVQQAFHRDGG